MASTAIIQPEHYDLYETMLDAVPNEAELAIVLYQTSIWMKDVVSTVAVDLPTIGADGIDPGMMRCKAPFRTPLERLRQAHNEVWFRFCSFNNGTPQTAEVDIRTPKTSRRISNSPHEYIAVAPVEAPPYFVQYDNLAYADPDEIPRHPITPEEALNLTRVIKRLSSSVQIPHP